MARWTMRQWTRERKWETRLAVALALFLGVLLGTLVSDSVRAARDSGTVPATRLARPLAPPSPVQLSTTFADVAQAVEPAVVNITTETVSERPRSRRRRAPTPFDDFFDRFYEFEQPRQRQSLGSGVLVDENGFILTNYHVVEGATRIQVRVAGSNDLHEAEVVGFDEDTDLAVIKIDTGGKLPYAMLGDSAASRVGDWVLAIGSPFGLSATVTAGIISYKGRSGQDFGDLQGQFKRYLQTDAAINMGNSGGPLVNMAGEVIGINTAIVSPRGVSAGVGFALPSNTARDVYNQILEHGRVIRGSIGITFRSVVSANKAIMRVFGAEHGVQIEEVNSAGPADRAGLRRGDVITHVDDTPIHAGDDLVDRITATPVGEKVRIRYIRDRKPQETTVKVEDFRAVHADRYSSADESETGQATNAKLGVSLQDMSVEEARRYGLPEDSVGPVVVGVKPGSFADDIGILRGDVVIELFLADRDPVRTHSVRDFKEAQEGLGAGDDVVVLVLRKSPQGGGFSSLHLGGQIPNGQ